MTLRDLIVDFIHQHFGDLVALAILFTGVASWLHYGNKELAEMLIAPALLALKLGKSTPPTNGGTVVR